MEDSPSYLSLSYGDVVDDSHRILGALRMIVGYVNSSHIDLHSSPMGASLAQALVDFTCETFNGDLGTMPTPDNILPICAVAELFTAEDDTIRRPLAIGPTSPDPLRISSPPRLLSLLVPLAGMRRPGLPSEHSRTKGKVGLISLPLPLLFLNPAHWPRSQWSLIRGPPLVPPSSSHPAHPTPRSYADTACKAAPIKQPALPAAPPSRPPSCKGRKISDYTAHSPSRRQLLIDVGDHAKDANLTTLFKDLSLDVLSRQGLHVKVLGVQLAYNGYSVPTDKIPSKRDMDILCGVITSHFKAHYKFMLWVSMPTSKLFL
ncbi:hypothetical protein CVT25_004373 [Psilocybe cyanescens]|uniref:Uncharacterized protein n=1 Tax=Psilocybe cyanescens TaxID=93625 RepID=A0A409XVW0_PSICY|nr:hypothetical protein CVT25_004373 [Psilocybe cyanescens]